MLSRGDIYGPAAGPASVTAAGAVDMIYRDNVLREGQPPLPVTDRSVAGGVRVGQFSLAQATVGLLALIAAVFLIDQKVAR